MAKTSRTKAPIDSEESIREAIKYAEKYAPENNVDFVRALNLHFQQQKSTRERGVSPVPDTGQPTQSFQLDQDPRYLANARELARRTLGGLRVIGGAPVKKGEFLDCVAVGSDNQWGCTGTLVASNVVVTAGHCADFATRVFFGNDVTKPGKIVRVKKRVRHPKYRQGKHNDLMVLLLEEKVDSVKPRKLAAKPLIDKATDGRVVGFGNTDPAGMFGYGIKRFVDVPVASPACLGKVNGQNDNMAYGCDAGLELVAGRPLLERDSCKGDSGGPFYILGDNEQWLLGGATSRATDSAMNNCGDGGVYVRVDRYRTWIDGIQGVALP
ncbi:MAG: serine protease [Terrimicrobiaceae bacterium]